MADGHGGARPGAGRPPNAETYAAPLRLATDQLAAAMPEVAEALIALALGLKPREKWVPAGTVTRKDVLRRPIQPPSPREDDADGPPLPPDDGIWTDDKGKPVVIDVPVFPGMPPGKLVKVEQVTGIPDVRAIVAIWARLGGTPGLAPEPDPAMIDLERGMKAALALLASRRAAPPEADPPNGPPAPSHDVRPQ